MCRIPDTDDKKLRRVGPFMKRESPKCTLSGAVSAGLGRAARCTIIKAPKHEQSKASKAASVLEETRIDNDGPAEPRSDTKSIRPVQATLRTGNTLSKMVLSNEMKNKSMCVKLCSGNIAPRTTLSSETKNESTRLLPGTITNGLGRAKNFRVKALPGETTSDVSMEVPEHPRNCRNDGISMLAKPYCENEFFVLVRLREEDANPRRGKLVTTSELPSIQGSSTENKALLLEQKPLTGSGTSARETLCKAVEAFIV